MGSITPLKRWLSGFSTWVAGDFLPIAFGGTGAVTAPSAFSNLGAAASGANADITSLSSCARISGLVDVSANAGALPAPPGSSTVLRVSSADGVGARVVIDSFGAGGNLVFRSSLGTAAAPSAVAGINLGQMSAFGYGATGYTTSARALVAFLTAETWTDTAQGTRIAFRTTMTGTATSALAYTIEPNGSLYPGADNAMDIGSASLRVRNAYLVNNPTVSSDAALKTPRASSAGGPALSAAELAAWAKVSPSVWILNGDTSGLLHVGYIAQAVQAAFAAQGLDITKYALWRQDTMPDGSTRSALVYAECAVFEAAYQRQQVGLLTRQVAALAKALNLPLPAL